MIKRDYFLIGTIGLGFFILYSFFLTAPGYMDAEYYFAMGLRILKTGGLSEPFLWNYLQPMAQIPHPGFTYWMPMPAFVPLLSMFLSGLADFTGAKIGPVIIAAFAPMITMAIAYDLSEKRSTAILAGILGFLPVFYSPYLGTTDSFGLMMVFGGLFFIIANKNETLFSLFLLGILAGLMHLTRADGLIWLAAAGYIAIKNKKNKLSSAGLVFIGYLTVMGPWFIRNWLAIGDIMPAGTARMFWLTEYNDLFSWQVDGLNYTNWATQGFKAILGNIGTAAIANLKTILVVQWQIILTPLILTGFYQYRTKIAIQTSFIAWALIFLVMTFVFPFAGMRGGFFHSGAAVQPLFWALGSCGFSSWINWGVKKRDWQPEKSGLIFGSSLVIVLFCMTGFIYWNRVIGKDLSNAQWNYSFQVTREIGNELEKFGYADDDLIMINNPPGLFAATEKSSIVIPNANVDTIMKAAEVFEVDYIVLELNHPEQLSDLYLSPHNETRLNFLGSINGIQYFEVPK